MSKSPDSPVKTASSPPPFVPGLPADTGVPAVAEARRGHGKAGRVSTVRRGKWEALLKAFRDRPAAFQAAAEATGVTVYIAKKAWSDGWPGTWPPIRDVLAEEVAAARELVQRREAERLRQDRLAAVRAEKERGDALRRAGVEAAEQEQQITQFARVGSLLALNGAAKVLDALGTVAEEVRETLISRSKVKGGPGVDPDAFVKMFARTSGVVRAAGELAQTALTMERVRTGKPIAVFGISPPSPESRTEAIEELDELVELLRQAKAGAGLPSGVDDDPDGPGGPDGPL